MTVKNSCHYEAIAEVIQSNLDCHANARNDGSLSLAHAVRLVAMTVKNNFKILNLVKSFLTSINFDSLSRKIKNPCLVINKFINRRVFV